MDSILELENSEVQQIVASVSEARELFKTNAAALFEDAFLVLTSSGAKTDQFKILRQIESVTDGSDESLTEDVQQQLSMLFDLVLNICAQVFRMGIKGTDEFQLILDDLGLKGNKAAPIHEVFQNAYLGRLELINGSTEDAQTAMSGTFSKKMPINLELADDNVMVSNPRLVDVEWETVYSINGKNINRLLQPRFNITLTLLCKGDFTQGGASECVARSAKRNQLRLKRTKFQCTYEELQHFHLKVKNACNAVTNLTRVPKPNQRQ